MQTAQFNFEGFGRVPNHFGGALTSHPKGKRPLSSRYPIHVTLRATKSVLRLPHVFGSVDKTLSEVARKHGVKVYKYANVGNHLHLAIKLRHIMDWPGFIRELTGRIGLICRHLLKGLWKFRPHTRIVRGWQKAFRIFLDYIRLNQLEGEGKICRSEIKCLADLRKQMFPNGPKDF